MGLDIHVYTNTQRVVGEDAKKIFVSEEPTDEAYGMGYRIPWINPDFPSRAEGVAAVPYSYDGDWHFRAGSYSGHTRFRNQICEMLGLGEFMVWIRAQDTDTHGPLEEFLNFSDCEGTIGPVVSTKLAKDFVDLEEKAREYSSGSADPYFWETYQNWKKAFTDASSNGFVVFT